jgi:hypothetical protein
MCATSHFVSVRPTKLGQTRPSLQNHGRDSTDVDVATVMTFSTSPVRLRLEPRCPVLGERVGYLKVATTPAMAERPILSGIPETEGFPRFACGCPGG